MRAVGAQGELVAGADADDELDPVAGGDLRPGELDWLGEEPAVGANEPERAVVLESQVVDAGVGGVEDAEPDLVGSHLDVGVGGAVDGDGVAEEAGWADDRRSEVEGAVAVEALVLEDDGEVVDAVDVWQPVRLVFGGVDDEHPGEAPVELFAGPLVGVGVVPQGGGRRVHGSGPVAPPGPWPDPKEPRRRRRPERPATVMIPQP